MAPRMHARILSYAKTSKLRNFKKDISFHSLILPHFQAGFTSLLGSGNSRIVFYLLLTIDLHCSREEKRETTSLWLVTKFAEIDTHKYICIHKAVLQRPRL